MVALRWSVVASVGLVLAGCGGGKGTECAPRASSHCADNLTVWYDSCERAEEQVETCSCGCLPDGSGCQTACQSPTAPDKPTDPSPANGATEVDVKSVSSVRCTGSSDPNDAGTVVFDFYFGTASPPPKLWGGQWNSTFCNCSPGLPEPRCLPGKDNLEPGTTYYWKVVAKNKKTGETTDGDLWSFTTKKDPAKSYPCPGLPTVTDADNNQYATVEIGSQCWMATNLAVGLLTTVSQKDNGIAEKSCIFEGAACAGSYTWNELMNYDKPGSLCPAGWRVPSVADWQALINHPDFARFPRAYPGYLNSNNLKQGSLAAYFWTTDEGSAGPDGTAKAVIIYHESKQQTPGLQTFNKGLFLSARCLK